MAQVELRNISKIYSGDTKVVDNVNIIIKDKEFLVLVGPSGCGKSTTLRMIAGLEEITSGELYIDNNLMNEVPPKDRDISMVFQNYALYPHMTVFENMAFGLKLRKHKKEDINERVNYAADILGLKEYLNRKPGTLSGGQRQRVAVGRSIVRKPKVFLFDEPLSNLDAKLRVQMRTEISKLHHKLDATMIYVTHDQTEAMTMGDRIVVMKDGIVNQIDNPMDLYNFPNNKFVAGFIGSPAMNFIDGKIISESGMVFVSSNESVKISLLKEQTEKLGNYINKEVTIGIRPENISIAENNNEKHYEIKTTLDVVEPMGNETIVYFNLSENPIIARVQSEERLNTSATYNLYMNLEKLHFFDRETENRIV